MRVLVWFGIMSMACAAGALADPPRPAEPPPRDFAGGQYIDSAGCVFLRDGRSWIAMLGDDQTQVCGFPPSQTAWGRGAEMPPGSAGDEAAQIEHDLTVMMVTAGGVGASLGDGDGVDGAAIGTREASAAGGGSSAAPAVEPAKGDAAVDGIGAEITRGLALRRQVAAIPTFGRPSDTRLCALLGLQQAGADPVAIGDDPTGGLCSGPAAKMAGYRMRSAAASPAGGASHAGGGDIGAGAGASSEPAKGLGNPKAAQPGIVAAKAAQPGVRAEAADPVAVATAGDQRGSDAIAGRAGRRAGTGAELIGPNARFVQIGRFDPAGAAIAAKALAGLGYPVVRETRAGGDAKRFVMAGPFATRDALIAALDRIRKAGYGAAVAR